MGKMTGFFLFLIVVVSWIVLKHQDQKLLLLQKEIPIALNTPVLLNIIARSVNDIVGTYQDKKIYQYILLDDGRSFIFESIAIEQSPGVYYADNINGIYIVVDKCLLYREISV